ncbi:hypothetical protein LCGC14_0545930 [marine sediment metagenome]|uniref:Uncharacterized protein n=1 Tax=marine sediment metagenome TaxID=412755 RepID=A0A0F9UZJ2_9ZZZZ
MKTITKVLGLISIITIGITMSYFLELYRDFTQLILVLTISGLIINIGFLFIYEWMQKKDEEVEELNKAIDLTRDYVKDLEQRYS